ncbi:C40 family peptidase [Actinomadura graeca]|nr:C40 family peptidase [Actinomadura graeca]
MLSSAAAKAAAALGAGVTAVALLWVLVIVLAVAAVSGAGCGAAQAGAAAPGAVVSQPAPAAAASDIPPDYLTLYRKAGRDYQLSWTVLAAIGKVESDHGRDRGPGVVRGANHAGAAGPMQIGVGGAAGNSWARFGVDGDGDGDRDVHDPADAIPAAARILIEDKGLRGDVRTAVGRYNGSGPQAEAYAGKVMALAGRYAAGGPAPGGSAPSGRLAGGPAGGACEGAGGGPGAGAMAGPTGRRILDWAMRWLKTPYQWGAGGWAGPTGWACAHGRCGRAFDCSGLTMHAVAQATGGRIKIAHFTGAQYNDPRGTHVAFGQLQPGDLVFFSHPGALVSHHVGVFAGAGTMVHAPHTGDWVKVSPITTGYYRREFSGGTRFSVDGRP